MEGIRNFIKIADGFYTSGQPSENDLVDARARGVRVVMNLAMLDSDHALLDERATVASLEMNYVHIPVPFSEPTVEQFLQFEKELLSFKEMSVLVHCALNWRASSFVALFAERHFGWSREQADELRRALWTPNDVWNTWTSAVRALPDTSFK